MRSLTKILFAVLFLAGTNSAFADTQDRRLTGFHAISLSASFDLYITQGGSESVKVEAPGDLMDKIITEVDGDVLKIRTKNSTFNWGNMFSNKRIVIHVSVKDIRSIGISGSGDVFFKDGIRADKLEIHVSGSGDVAGKVAAKTLQVSVTGSGDISLSGSAENSTVGMSGSGDFSGRNLVTAISTVRVSGSGDVTVNATQRLDARISGSGDIRYTGGASQVSTSSSGSGDIHKF